MKMAFLMVEGGQIGGLEHSNDAGTMPHELLKIWWGKFKTGIRMGKDREDTIVIVTANMKPALSALVIHQWATKATKAPNWSLYRSRDYAPNFNFGAFDILVGL